jgi:hypothetical protein
MKWACCKHIIGTAQHFNLQTAVVGERKINGDYCVQAGRPAMCPSALVHGVDNRSVER